MGVLGLPELAGWGSHVSHLTLETWGLPGSRRHRAPQLTCLGPQGAKRSSFLFWKGKQQRAELGRTSGPGDTCVAGVAPQALLGPDYLAVLGKSRDDPPPRARMMSKDPGNPSTLPPRLAPTLAGHSPVHRRAVRSQQRGPAALGSSAVRRPPSWGHKRPGRPLAVPRRPFITTRMAEGCVPLGFPVNKPGCRSHSPWLQGIRQAGAPAQAGVWSLWAAKCWTLSWT